MAFPTAVNSQITDAVSQSSVQVLGSAPSVALANLFQATSHALSLAALNATFAQQQLQILNQAVTAQGVALIYSANGVNPKALTGGEAHG
jgi:hypothetical protein